MSERKSFLLRTSPEVLDALRRWAAQEMRSVNAQVEYALRDALRRQGYLNRDDDPPKHSRSPWRFARDCAFPLDQRLATDRYSVSNASIWVLTP